MKKKAGRKKLGAKKRVQVTIQMKPILRKKVDNYLKMNCTKSMSYFLENIIKEYFDNLKKI